MYGWSGPLLDGHQLLLVRGEEGWVVRPITRWSPVAIGAGGRRAGWSGPLLDGYQLLLVRGEEGWGVGPLLDGHQLVLVQGGGGMGGQAHVLHKLKLQIFFFKCGPKRPKIISIL